MLLASVAHRLPDPIRHRLWLAYFRRHEQGIAYLKRWVPRDRTSVDVGAWKGGYTHHLARVSRHVYAYEPNPTLGADLQRRAAANVTVRRYALSNATGRATLHVPVDPSGQPRTAWGQLSPRRPTGGGGAAAAGSWTTEVETRRLDDEAVGDVGFIKIDVEGHEQRVLEGALGTIREHRPVLLIELEQRHLDVDLRDVMRWILSWGYQGFFLAEGRLNDIADFSYEVHQKPYEAELMLTQFSPRLLKRYANNFFFAPEERAAVYFPGRTAPPAARRVNGAGPRANGPR